jgi:hypothetical protein
VGAKRSEIWTCIGQKRGRVEREEAIEQGIKGGDRRWGKGEGEREKKKKTEHLRVQRSSVGSVRLAVRQARLRFTPGFFC